METECRTELCFGNKVRLLKLFKQNLFSPTDNVNKALINHWSKPGDELITDIPNPITINGTHWSVRNQNIPSIATYSYDEYNHGNHRVVNGSYLKMSTLSLTYQFSKDVLKHLGLNRLELNLTGTNLFTLCSSKLKGQTPQQGGFSDIQLTDRPQYTFGLDVSF